MLTSPEQSDSSSQQDSSWHPALLLVFRFIFCYIAIYAAYILDRSQLSELISWLAQHVFYLAMATRPLNSGSGDTTYNWELVSLYLALAAVAALVWSLLDRRRHEYERLYAWLRLLVRFVLALTMLTYGIDKVIPVQFGPLTLSRFAMPFGALTPMGVLWAFMAASPGYTMFTGSIETIAGILLLVPRLTTLGALVAAAALTNIFALNLFYDVPVKLFSFHLLLFAVFLTLPDIPRLTNILLLKRTAQPAPSILLFRDGRFEKAFAWAAIVLAAAYVLISVPVGLQHYRQYLAQIDEKAPFYGVWIVDEFTPPPSQGVEYRDQRWDRLIFESTTSVNIIGVDGRLSYYAA